MAEIPSQTADPPALPTVTPTPLITGSMLPDMSDDLGIPYIAPVTDGNFAACDAYATNAFNNLATEKFDPVAGDFTISSGWSVGYLYPTLFVSGRMVSLRMEVTRTGANILFTSTGASSSGLIRIFTMGGTVTKYRPTYPVVVTLSPLFSSQIYMHAVLDTGGNLDIRGTPQPGATAVNASQFNVDGSWLLP